MYSCHGYSCIVTMITHAQLPLLLRIRTHLSILMMEFFINTSSTKSSGTPNEGLSIAIRKQSHIYDYCTGVKSAQLISNTQYDRDVHRLPSLGRSKHFWR